MLSLNLILLAAILGFCLKPVLSLPSKVNVSTKENTKASLPENTQLHRIYFHVLSDGHTPLPLNEMVLRNQVSALQTTYANTGLSFQLANITYTANSTWYNIPAAYNGHTKNEALALHYRNLYSDMGSALRIGDQMDINVYLTGKSVNISTGSYAACSPPQLYKNMLAQDGCFATYTDMVNDDAYLQKILPGWFSMQLDVCQPGSPEYSNYSIADKNGSASPFPIPSNTTVVALPSTSNTESTGCAPLSSSGVLSCSSVYPQGYLCDSPRSENSIQSTIPSTDNMRNRVYSSMLYTASSIAYGCNQVRDLSHTDSGLEYDHGFVGPKMKRFLFGGLPGHPYARVLFAIIS